MSDRSLVRLRELRCEARENRVRAELELANCKRDEAALDRALELLGDSGEETQETGAQAADSLNTSPTRTDESSASWEAGGPSFQSDYTQKMS
jgi:hypothetical protein